MADSKAKHGGARKIGRNKTKCANYRQAHTRERNKLKRILRSNGRKAAEIYAQEHGVILRG